MNTKTHMPVEFTEFKNLCELLGCIAKDQRYDKTPANIFSTRTKNGVKVEIKSIHKKSFYVAGEGLNQYKLSFLENELLTSNKVILKRNKKHLHIQFESQILKGFENLIKTIEDIDQLIQRQRASRFYEAEFGDNNFFFIASVLRLAYTFKAAGSPWSRLIIGDSLDKIALVGYSLQGRLQEKSGKNPYREHPVPLDWIASKAFEMIKEGKSDEEIALMIKRNFKLVLISDEEQDLIDNKLGYKTTMPDNWKDGDDVLARLKLANIKLES